MIYHFSTFFSRSLQDQMYFYRVDVQGFHDTEVIYEDGTGLKSFITVLKSGVTVFCWNTVLWWAIKYSITYLIEWKNKFSSAPPLCRRKYFFVYYLTPYASHSGRDYFCIALLYSYTGISNMVGATGCK